MQTTPPRRSSRCPKQHGSTNPNRRTENRQIRQPLNTRWSQTPWQVPTPATHYPNGYIRSGTVVGIVEATGKAGPYDPGASNGTEDAAGILFADCRVIRSNGTTATHVGSGVLVHGFVDAAKLPFPIDAAGAADLVQIRFENLVSGS
ncbi:hypothetical protein GII33_14175 [Gordonia pseudamarae]|uniref:head decoration protein n=1 Tax=Gordonia pseudamarae TaxID=2831662 RepID=UPI001AF4E553|nr:head decoration protein [Gordonia pseudamarae]QHN26931.1 hypothetical protein GII33_14175 [Gordonia pseudamarae]